MAEMAMAERHRILFVVCLTIAVSVSSSEVLDLGGDTVVALGESSIVAAFPLTVVSSFAKNLEAENRHLMQQNAALRSQGQVDQAKQAVAIAGGLLPKEGKSKLSIDQQAAAAPPAAELPPAVQKGVKVMNAYQSTIKKLEAKVAQESATSMALSQQHAEDKIDQQEQKLQVEAASSVEPSAYHRIPFFKFTAGSKQLTDMADQQACQTACDNQMKCKSYSWSISKNTCIWSVDAIHYDHNYIFLVKSQIATAGDPAAAWREFPGVKFITAHSEEKNNVEYDQCKSICETDVTCKSLSYRTDTKFCAWSSNGMSYDQYFNYFEKDQSSVSKATESKEEQLKQSQVNMRKDMEAAETNQEEEASKEKQEDQVLKHEQAQFVSNQPTNSQENHLKMTVKFEMQSMDAKFAMQNSQKKAEMAKKAEDEFHKSQLDAVSRLSELEAEVKRLEIQKKKAFAKLTPLESDASNIEITLAKLNEKIKILAVDRLLKDKAVANAENAIQASRKADTKDTEAITTLSVQYNDAKKAVKVNEDEKTKLTNEVATQKDAMRIKAEQLRTARGEEKRFKVQYKTQESGNKDAAKEMKAMLQKQKLVLATDHEKAFTSKMVALKAKEKIAKSRMATAKVSIAADNGEMKDVKTAEDRRALEKKTATARGNLFKAEGTNEEVTTALLDATKQLAKTKETLHKAKSNIVKAKKEQERQNIDNKLTQLESENSKSPF